MDTKSPSLTGRLLAEDFAAKLPGLPKHTIPTIDEQIAAFRQRTGGTDFRETTLRAYAHATHRVRNADGTVSLVCRCGETRTAAHECLLGWECRAKAREDEERRIK